MHTIAHLLAALLIVFSQSAAVALPQSTPAPLTDITGKSVTVGDGKTTVDAELQRLQSLPLWRGIATRSGWGPAFTPAKTSPFAAQATYRHNEKAPLRGPISALRLVYCNANAGVSPLAGATGGEVPNAQPITVSAGIELNSNLSLTAWVNGDSGAQNIPITFGGAKYVVIAIGQCAMTDTLYVYLRPAQGYYVHSFCAEPTGKTCPGNAHPQSAVFDGNNVLYSATWTGNGSQTTFTTTAPATYGSLAPGSFKVLAPNAGAIVSDVNNGDGTGSCPAGNGVASCSINYANRTISVTFAAAIASGTSVFPSAVGASGADQSDAASLSPFASGNAANLSFAPVAILGQSATRGATSLRALGIFGDSLANGSGNTFTDQSFINTLIAGAYGTVKGAISGELLCTFAQNIGRARRMSYMGAGVVDRAVADYATNDIYSGGVSLSQLIGCFQAAQPAIVSTTATQSADTLWWTTIPPRTNLSNVPLVPLTGPYTAAGAAYGSGAVVSPTPLGGAFRTKQLGNAIKVCTVTGNGTTGPYTCSFGTPTMVGSLWSDGDVVSLIDSGAQGAAATTLTGLGVAGGNHTPSAGTASITLSAALATGKTMRLYALASGPSLRNAWHYVLYNWAVPMGWSKGLIDLAACVEATPGSAGGSGSGTWQNIALTSDGTHFQAATQATTLPGCIGPNGTTPSPLWTF